MRAVIVADGVLAPTDRRWLEDADLVIAADGGAAAVVALGRRPDRVVGDLDSISPVLVNELSAAGVSIERHPPDKDASDTELAVSLALEAGADEVILIGGTGGDRLDHELANLLLLADPELAGRDVRAVHGPTSVRFLRGGDRLTLHGAIGDLVTLLPITGEARGVTTDGLRFPLASESLAMGRSRGLSNEVTAAPASVGIEDGGLLVIETAVHGRTP